MNITRFRWNIFLPFFIIVCVVCSYVLPSHNASRYFPFLERPEEYVRFGRSHISPSVFFAKASTAFKRGGGNTGIPELWGNYDLLDVINSLKAVTEGSGAIFTNPIEKERGQNDEWKDKSIKYKVDGKVKARGIILHYRQELGFKGLSVGASVPIMHVNTNDRFTFVQGDSAYQLQNLRSGEILQLDRIRRTVHADLGLKGGDWEQTGFGDLDVNMQWNNNWDHPWMLRSIDFNVMTGIVIPTGSNSDTRYPSSVSFMGNGHWTWYFDNVTEFELKQDWVLGCMLGCMYQFDNTRKLRIPVYQEPAIFSALVAVVKIERGITFKISPYLFAKNLTDGVNFQLRYTYLRHNNDIWKDKRTNPTVRSYLQLQSGDVIGSDTLTQEDINNNIIEKKNRTRWRSHYITLQFSYDSKEAACDWILDPTIYLTYDYLMNGNGVCKTHQLTVGVELHF
jgi:hypothetical protein